MKQIWKILNVYAVKNYTALTLSAFKKSAFKKFPVETILSALGSGLDNFL